DLAYIFAREYHTSANDLVFSSSIAKLISVFAFSIKLLASLAGVLSVIVSKKRLAEFNFAFCANTAVDKTKPVDNNKMCFFIIWSVLFLRIFRVKLKILPYLTMLLEY